MLAAKIYTSLTVDNIEAIGRIANWYGTAAFQLAIQFR